MGRKVKTVTQPVWYVPDIGDNRQDPDPFRVLLSPISARDLQEINHARAVRTIRRSIPQGASPEDAMGALKTQAWQDDDLDDFVTQDTHRILRERIVEVVGYAHENIETGDLSTPATGEDFVDLVLAQPGEEYRLLDQIWDVLVNASSLSEGMEGNFGRQPNSSGLPIDSARRLGNVIASTTNQESGGAVTSTSKTTPTGPGSIETQGAA